MLSLKRFPELIISLYRVFSGSEPQGYGRIHANPSQMHSTALDP